MAAFSGPEIVNDGLVFAYDMDNPLKSWKGKPTTNLCYHRNPVTNVAKEDIPLDPQTAAGSTFDENHPGRLIITTVSGGTIGTMINSGTNGGNWQVTHHAYWQWDDQKNAPVCVMRDLDGQWKAHSFNTGYTLNSLGWSEGQQYSISWDQWTNNLNKCADAGIYYRRASDSARSFYAGQARSQSTAFNTKLYTWERVYATFTVPAGMDPTYGLGMYCYGHTSGGRGTVKMTNIQWEEGTPSGFVTDESGQGSNIRSNTESLVNWTRNSTITASSLTYNTDGTFEFDGSTNTITIPNIELRQDFTLECWIKFDGISNEGIFGHGLPAIQRGLHIMVADSGRLRFGMYGNDTDFMSLGLQTNTWYHMAFTYNSTSFVKQMYLNGIERTGTPVQTQTAYIEGPGLFKIGMTYGTGSSAPLDGSIAVAKMYNKVLTAAEVKRNFAAYRKRFGL